MKTISFYKSLLEALSVTIDDNDQLLLVNPLNTDLVDPISIKVMRDGIATKRPLVLPTKRVLKMEEDGSTVKFHPMSESVFRGQSPVFNKLVALASARLMLVIHSHVTSILELAANTDESGKLTTAQIELMRGFPAVNRNTLVYWQKLQKACTGVRGNYPSIRLNIKRDNTIGDEIFMRTCGISVPPLKSEGGMFGKRAPSKVAHTAVLAAYRLVTRDFATKGSNSQSAPYFLSFLQCFKEAATHLNAISNALGKDRNAANYIADGWFRGVDKITKWAEDELPQQFDDNIGAASTMDNGEIGRTENNTPAAVSIPEAPTKEQHFNPNNALTDANDMTSSYTPPTTFGSKTLGAASREVANVKKLQPALTRERELQPQLPKRDGYSHSNQGHQQMGQAYWDYGQPAFDANGNAIVLPLDQQVNPTILPSGGAPQMPPPQYGHPNQTSYPPQQYASPTPTPAPGGNMSLEDRLRQNNGNQNHMPYPPMQHNTPVNTGVAPAGRFAYSNFNPNAQRPAYGSYGGGNGYANSPAPLTYPNNNMPYRR